MANFCKYCGVKLTKGNEKFCPKCGKQLQSNPGDASNGQGNAEQMVYMQNSMPERMSSPMASAPVQNAPMQKAPMQHVPMQNGPIQSGQAMQQFGGAAIQPQASEAGHSIYIIDFFKRMFRKSNIAVIIYLILNVLIICGITMLMLPDNLIVGFLIGLVLYIISLTIALSPIGEWLLRVQTGCSKIKKPQYVNRLTPIFNEVYNRAIQANPNISRDICLYMNDDECPNAFATGRKTICVTKGLLQMSDAQIRATLSHEFGHLSHKDTDLILMVTVGNMIVSAIITIVRIGIAIFQIFSSIMCLFMGGEEGFFASIMLAIYNIMMTITVDLLVWLWTKIGTLLVMKSSRGNEYEADEFAFRLGYGNELCAMLYALDMLDGGKHAKGLFATLASSHPDTEDRIARLQSLGATFRYY